MVLNDINSNETPSGTIKNNTAENKWCPHHKVNTHDAKECIFLKQRDNKLNHSKELLNQQKSCHNLKTDSVNSLTEVVSEYCKPESHTTATLKSQPNMPVIFDTVARLNFISDYWVERLDLKTKSCKQVVIKFFDSREIVSNLTINEQISFSKIPDMKFHTTIYVVKSNKRKIILGNDWMIKHDCQILPRRKEFKIHNKIRKFGDYQ